MTCRKCGGPDPTKAMTFVEVHRGIFMIACRPVCDPCFYRAMWAATEADRQFSELLELGVNKQLANEVLADRVERGDFR